MPVCPECGGWLHAFHFIRLRPGDPVRCRWCRARLSLSPLCRRLRDGILLAVGTAAAIVCGIQFALTDDDLLWLIILVSAIAVALVIGAVLELLLPVVVLRARGDPPAWRTAGAAPASSASRARSDEHGVD